MPYGSYLWAHVSAHVGTPRQYSKLITWMQEEWNKGSFRMATSTEVTCGYEFMLKVISRLHIHSKLIKYKRFKKLNKISNIWTTKYNNFENTSTYNNEPWGQWGGGGRIASTKDVRSSTHNRVWAPVQVLPSMKEKTSTMFGVVNASCSHV